MHFARNARALDLLGFLQVRGKRGELLARLQQFALSLLALRHVFHDAVPLRAVVIEGARSHAYFDPLDDTVGGNSNTALPAERSQRVGGFRNAPTQFCATLNYLFAK